MSRRLQAGSIIITPAEARMLYQAANIGDVRSRYRIGDTKIYRLLTEISLAAFSVADDGNLARQDAASDEPEFMTVRQVAQAARRSERAVRLDCQHGRLPATRNGTTWLIPTAEAKTYVASRRSH